MSDQKQTHQPSLILKPVDTGHFGLRLMDIGRHQRFDAVIKRLRLDFPLITGKEIEGQFWWIVTTEQRDGVVDFARRNGLKLVEG